MSAAIAERLLGAINDRDTTGLERLLDERSEVVTGRASHAGPEAIVAWASKEYDHLVRRYEIHEFRGRGDRVLALGEVQYAWKDGGAVADSSPIALTIAVEAGRLRLMELHDDPVAALAGFER